MPVIYDAEPWIAENLPIARPKIGAGRDDVLPDRRLRVKSGVFERDLKWTRRGTTSPRLGADVVLRDVDGSRCHIRRGDGGGKVRDLDRCARLNWIPAIGIAGGPAVEPVDEECPLGVNGERLLACRAWQDRTAI